MPQLGKQVALYALDGSSLIRVEAETTGELKTSLYGKKTDAADSALRQAAMTSAAYTGDALVAGIVGYHAGLGEVRQLQLDQPNGDDRSVVAGSMPVESYPLLYNSSGWDRQRNNYEVTALARTAITDTPSITVTIAGKSTLGTDYVSILASAAIATVSVTTLIVYPGNSAAANAKADQPLPRLWRVQVVNGDTDSITYSISANYTI